MAANHIYRGPGWHRDLLNILKALREKRVRPERERELAGGRASGWTLRCNSSCRRWLPLEEGPWVEGGLVNLPLSLHPCLSPSPLDLHSQYCSNRIVLILILLTMRCRYVKKNEGGDDRFGMPSRLTWKCRLGGLLCCCQ